jgi:pilin isopeptide linkage protein
MKTVKAEEGVEVPDATFTFKLTAVSTTAEGLSGKMPMPEAAEGAQEMTMDVPAGEWDEFGKFPMVVPGTYTYTITEENTGVDGFIYSSEVYTVVYEVKANAETNALERTMTINGTLVEGDEDPSDFEFINEYVETSVPVTKVWNDNNDEEKLRPTSITVRLLADGEEVDSIEINEEMDWTYTFEHLPAVNGETGEKIEYTITEDDVAKYSTKITGDAKDGYTIENTHTPIPKTADASDMTLWIGLMALSICAAAIVWISSKRRKEQE